MTEDKNKQASLSQAPAETSPEPIKKVRVEVLVKTKVVKGNKILILRPGIIEKPWQELLEAADKAPGILHKFGAK